MRLLLEKTHGKPVGTISTHGGVRVRKVAPGKWRPVGKDKQAKVAEAETSYAGGGWEKQLAKRETEMSALNYERCYAYDHTGNEIFMKDGQATQIQFTAEEVQKMSGAMIFTHNHPGVGGSFSPEDISMLYKMGVSEFRAVGKYETFTASFKPKMEHFAYNRFVDKMTDIEQEVRAEFEAKIQSGKITVQSATTAHFHEIWTRVALQVDNFKYKKVSRG